MNGKTELMDEIVSSLQTHAAAYKDPSVAHLVINENKVLGLRAVPGLEVQVKELEDGVDVNINVAENTVIEKTVHLCFGMLPKSGLQRILMNVEVQTGAKISILAHCVFPNAVRIQHIMDGQIHIGKGAEYAYLERHIHGKTGGIQVYPKAVVTLEENSRFRTDFELLKGRVGMIDISYETFCGRNSVMEMTTKINGIEDDIVKIREIGHLEEYATGVLTSKIAVRNRAKAEVYNKLTASAAYARGHVDCKEIVQDRAIATATPIVQVNHPQAHITHEAAIGSVDTRQLETLMSRGLDEEEAVELIIEGLLS